MTYIILGLFILVLIGSALWSSGGILLLDYIATDTQVIPWFQNAWYLIPQIPASLFGYEWGTKISYIAILVLAAYLGVLFARRIAVALDMESSEKQLIEILGGIFFLINPFAYERMMVQPVIYLGIILLGYAIYFLYFFEKKHITPLRAILIGSLMGFALNLFLHASYMIVVILGIYGLYFVRSYRDIRNIALISGMVIFWNLNWILAPLLGIKTSVDSIATFSLANYEAFQTQALAPLGVWSTNTMLYGFWGERYANHYARVDILSSLWYIGGIAIILIALGGFTLLWKSGKKSEVSIAGIIAFISLFFAIGIASPISRGITEWCIGYIPWFSGYREPQKWIGILMIIEGIGWIIGIAYVFQKYGRDIFVRWSIFGIFAILLLVWSPGPLMGYHGQLRTTVYPEGFSVVRTKLLEEAPGSKVLALPWHAYMGCSWTGRPTISNPVQALLSPLQVVSSDNIEAGNILYSNSEESQSKDIELFLKDHDSTHLQTYGFTHILFMKGCGMSESSDWLDEIPKCQKTYDDPTVVLYKCEE